MWTRVFRQIKEFRGAPAHPLSDDSMLACFLSALEVRTKWMEPLLKNDASKLTLLGEIKDALANFKNTFETPVPRINDVAWNEAYRLERLLALVEPSDNLLAELRRRTAEAAEERIDAAPRLAAAVEAALPLAVDTSKLPPVLRDGGEGLLRPLLLTTLEELHWAYQRKFYSRPIQKSATYRIVWVGIMALCTFLLPYVWLYSDAYEKKPLPLNTWAWLPLYTAVTAGLFGALFSRLLYLQKNWDILSLGAIEDAKDFTSILLRACVGVTGAVVVYFFLQSGVLGGGLFPDFTKLGISQSLYPGDESSNNRRVNPVDELSKDKVLHADDKQSKDQGIVSLLLVSPNAALALLVVWSFLAGFSERLVPSLLESTETAVRKSDTNK